MCKYVQSKQDISFHNEHVCVCERAKDTTSLMMLPRRQRWRTETSLSLAIIAPWISTYRSLEWMSNPYRYESRAEKKITMQKNDTKEGILISVQVIYPSGKHLSEWYALYTDNSETKNSLERYCTLITNNALLFEGLGIFFLSSFHQRKMWEKIFNDIGKYNRFFPIILELKYKIKI